MGMEKPGNLTAYEMGAAGSHSCSTRALLSGMIDLQNTKKLFSFLNFLLVTF
jgi:hypothetical protein